MNIKEKLINHKIAIIIVSITLVVLIGVIAMIIIPKENKKEVANTNIIKETTSNTIVNEESNEIEEEIVNEITNEIVNELLESEEVINETENLEGMQVAKNTSNDTNDTPKQETSNNTTSTVVANNNSNKNYNTTTNNTNANKTTTTNNTKAEQTTKPTTQTTTTQPTNTNTNANKPSNTTTTTTPANNNTQQETPKTQEQPKEEQKPQETPKQEGNPSLANTTFTKYNAERTAHAVNYINNKMKEDKDYSKVGGRAVAVTTKPCQDWFSYSGDYKLNGVSGAGRLVKVYVEDVYMYDSKGINTFKYDTRVYAHQTIENQDNVIIVR